MGILDKFSSVDSSSTRASVTVSLESADWERVNDAVTAMRTKGCKGRGDFGRKAIMSAVDEVEQGFGGREKVVQVANKIDPEGARHVRRSRGGE